MTALASESSLGALASSADTSSIESRVRDFDRVEGFLGFGAGFTDPTSLRFLDVHVEVLVPKIVPCISFMVSVMLAFISPINDRGSLVDPAAESSLGSSRRLGSFAPLSSDSSLPLEP